MRRRGLAILAVCLVMLFCTSTAFSQTSQVSSGLTYLISVQNPDGSWGSETSDAETLPSTVAAIETLKVLNQTNTQTFSNALVWLQSQGMQTTDYFSERIHALMVSGADKDLLLTYLDDLIGAWGGYNDYDVNNLDTALALQALKAVNYSDTNVISSALGYLISTRNADSGWGFYKGDDSNVYMTAIVLRTLAQFKSTYDLNTPIASAASYLLSKQNIDGGFGSPASTVYETALAVIGLINSGASDQQSAISIQNALNYLTVTQRANGSWDDDPYSTALALRALASVKPNLSISSSDITFSKSNPTVGDTITITANIKNTGPAQADNVLVRFYNADPNAGGLQIEETIVALVPAFGGADATITYTIPSASSKAVFVSIDPLSTIDETDETDNTASKNLTSATLPDLSIASADITIYPSNPDPNMSISVLVRVRNHGETDAHNVPIDIYDGDPSSGGVRLQGSGVIPLIPAGSFTDIAAVIDSSRVAAGMKTVTVLVDQTNLITESDKTNNSASKTFRVGGLFPDLNLRGAIVSYEPLYPQEQSYVTFTVPVDNRGEAEAGNVLVRFYLGDPDSGGTKIGSDAVIPAIAAGGKAYASVTWNTTGRKGKNLIFIKVDPLNTIQESNEQNNKISISIDVAATTGANLMVSSGEITFVPASPVSGDVVTISAVIRNNSLQTVNNVVVEFSDGDPRVSGTRIIGQMTITTLKGGAYGSVTIQIPWNTAGLTGRHNIYVNVDPFNEIIEIDEKDNLAYAAVEIRDVQKPDLTVLSIDKTGLLTDLQTLTISGHVRATIQNKGNQPSVEPFEITAFEDLNKNKTLEGDTDNVLGTVSYSGSLAPGASDTLDIPVSGTVLFRDSLISVMADSGNIVSEADETNNVRNTGQQCSSEPSCGKWDVVEKFSWTGSPVYPGLTNVYSVPLVAHLTDDNGDGVLDDNDTPSIVFHTEGIIRAISGADGHELFTVQNLDYWLHSFSHFAVGDIDNDGKVDIVGLTVRWTPAIIALNNDGSLKWMSPRIYIPTGYFSRWAVSIVDLDGDGKPEIISGPNVLNNDGSIRWSVPINDGIPVVADLDLDGIPEILIGNSAYRNDGTLYWTYSGLSTILAHAVVNLDDDPYPEIIQVAYIAQIYPLQVYAFEHDGKLKWGPVKTGSAGLIAVPTIADFDGDGKPEIGISGQGRYTVLRADGSTMWESVVHDGTPGGVSGVAFDFDGDGAAEIAYNDMQYLRIFNGKNGEVLYSTPNSTATYYDSISVADVNNDGSAEIIANANSGYTYDYRGIRVFGNSCNAWPNTRKIWNEYNYHITNVNDDGTIPAHEQNNWETYNNYRQQPALPGNAWSKPDLTVSLITAAQLSSPVSVIISTRVGNGGASTQVKGVVISVFDGDPQQGGALIGIAKTSRDLGPGEYEDVLLTWNNPSIGSHTIFSIVDMDNKINECNKNNNIASGTFTFGDQSQLQHYPDLTISSTDIAITPPNTIEGQTAKISAIVHNNGTLGASDVVVSFYDGDMNYGGTLIGSVTKSFVDAGASALAEVLWNTMGQSGRNYVHVVVDPQGLIVESNENNNAALQPVDVSPPSKPDLAITSSDITFSNLNPQVGQPLVITATVHNFGTAAAGIKVNCYDGSPSSGGVLLSTYTIARIIPFGGQTEIAFAIDTVGLSGNRAFHIVLDPENAIDEINETNNTAWNSLTIGPSGLSLGVSADKASYHSNEIVLITVTTGNLTELSRSGYLEVRITDLNSNVVSAVALNQAMTLGPNENIMTSYTWNTGHTFSGDYRVYTVFLESGNVRAKADAGISILKDMTITSKVTTDRIAYFPNQPVTVTSTISSLSANYIFENLTVKIAISDQLSAISLHTETQPVAILLPGQITELRTYWNTSTNPPGAYTITLEIRDTTGALVSSSTAILTISSEIKPSKLLRGQISVDRQSILQGEPLNISYQVTNVGNMDISEANLSIRTVHVVNLSVYDTLTDQAAVLMGAAYINAQQLGTGTYSAKDYLVILAAEINGIEESLASTYFRVEGAPSAPSLNTPAHSSDVETLTPTLSVNNATDPNDDRLTYEFQVYADQGLTTLVAESTLLPEGASITSWQVTAALQENSWYFWRARAYDNRLYGQWMDPAAFRVNVTNEPPTAPTLSAPADSSYVDTLWPVLAVNNATDPDSVNLTYNFVVALDPDFANIVDQQIGVFAGQGSTSWQVTVPLQENSWYYWKAQADDWLITGPWMPTARFFLNTTNEAPTAPVIIDPIDNSEIASRDVVIAISNSTDPDSTTITYLFEVDSALTFDSLDRVISGSVQQGQYSTSWMAAGLKDNTYYYARVKASDGSAESPLSAVVGFFVNTVNDAPTVPVLANPSNGAGVNSFNPILSVHNATDIDGDILTYEFEVYADAALTNLISSASAIQETSQITGWTVPVSLTENSTYFWHARAYDGQFFSPWMALASFTVNTANDAPSAPSLNAPAQGSSLSSLTPTLSIHNATDPDSDTLTYDFEVYAGTTLVRSITAISQNTSGITSVTLSALSDNTTYTWRARAYDGDRYGAWMDMATFSIHLPSQNITSTIDFDPDTLNQKSKGNWVTVYIELPVGYNVANINISSLRLNGTIPAVTWPYAIGDYDHDGIPDLMVKFDRNAVINLLPNGNRVKVTVTGTVGATSFEGVDYIRVIH